MGKKIRKAKDPSAPKPPLNSYMEFSHDERPRILLELENLSTKEIVKEIGTRWRNLDQEEKAKYEQRFRDNKEKYLVEKQKYEKTNSIPASIEEPAAPINGKKRKKKKKKDPLAPKLPLSSFMEFGKEERPRILVDLGSVSLSEVGKELGRRWRELGKEQKKVYEEKSKANRSTYMREREKLLLDKESSPDVSLPSESSESPDHDQPAPAVLSMDCPATSSSSPSIRLSDLGFAQQKKYPWHPALKTGVMARGSRVKVTFFGTGQSGIVDKSKWLVYSQQAEDKIKTKSLLRNAAFKLGLAQMKNLRDKFDTEGSTSTVTVPGIGFTPQLGGRKFRSLNKDHLQKEEEENLRQMERKMKQSDGGKFWTCRDCDWKGVFSHKAKAHARDCGQRKRLCIKKSQEKKFQCSNGECELSFSLQSQLQAHYKSTHFQPSQVYNCIPCQKTFREWKNFKRHGQEKHGGPGKFLCSQCSFKTNRKETLMRHTINRHQGQEVIMSLLDDLLSKVVEGDVMGDQNQKNLVVSSLLDDILSNVVSQNMMDAQAMIEEELQGSVKIYPYEKARNARIAQIQLEFDQQFPTFRKDVQELRVVSNPVRMRKKKGIKTAERKSSRIQDQIPPVLALVDNDEMELQSGGSGAQEDSQESVVMLIENDGSGGNGTGVHNGGDVEIEYGDVEVGVGEAEACAGNVPGAAANGDMGVILESFAANGDVGVILESGAANGDMGVIRESGNANGDMGVILEAGAVVKVVVDAAAENVEAGEVSDVPGKFGCLPCEMTFRYLSTQLISVISKDSICRDTANLRRHVLLVHGFRELALKCPRPWCDKEFHILAELLQHKGQCLKICPTCNKTFIRLDKYVGHMRAHVSMNKRMMV